MGKIFKGAAAAGITVLAAAGILTLTGLNPASAFFAINKSAGKSTVRVGSMNITAENVGELMRYNTTTKEVSSFDKKTDRFLPGNALMYYCNVYRTGDLNADVAELVTITVKPGSGKTLTTDDAKYFSVTTADGQGISSGASYVNATIKNGNLVKTYVLNTDTDNTSSDYNEVAPIGDQPAANYSDQQGNATNKYVIRFDRNAGTGTAEAQDTHLMGCEVSAVTELYAVQDDNKADGSDITFTGSTDTVTYKLDGLDASFGTNGTLTFGGDYAVFDESGGKSSGDSGSSDTGSDTGTDQPATPSTIPSTGTDTTATPSTITDSDAGDGGGASEGSGT